MAEKLSIADYESQLDELYSSMQDSLYQEDVFNYCSMYEDYASLGKAKKKYLDICLKMLNTLVDEEENDDAMVLLASWYYYGVFVEQDFDKAMSLFEDAAEFGNTNALVFKGKISYLGLIGATEEEEAFKLLVPAAISGNEEAIYILGDMYYNGDYVEQDDNICFDLYQKALTVVEKFDVAKKIESCESEIYYRLAKCYMEEVGTYADYNMAIYYANMALGLALARKPYHVLDNEKYITSINDLVKEINKKM